MSPEKRAFTVERVGVNANAAGRRSHSAKHKIVSLLPLLLLLVPPSLSLFLFSFPLPLLTHPEWAPFLSLSLCVCFSRYWLLRVVFPSLFTSPLWCFITTHRGINSLSLTHTHTHTHTHTCKQVSITDYYRRPLTFSSTHTQTHTHRHSSIHQF